MLSPSTRSWVPEDVCVCGGRRWWSGCLLRSSPPVSPLPYVCVCVIVVQEVGSVCHHRSGIRGIICIPIPRRPNTNTGRSNNNTNNNYTVTLPVRLRSARRLISGPSNWYIWGWVWWHFLLVTFRRFAEEFVICWVCSELSFPTAYPGYP